VENLFKKELRRGKMFENSLNVIESHCDRMANKIICSVVLIILSGQGKEKHDPLSMLTRIINLINLPWQFSYSQISKAGNVRPFSIRCKNYDVDAFIVVCVSMEKLMLWKNFQRKAGN
jgi:hypothetical protein